jgi:hypothetical protein
VPGILGGASGTTYDAFKLLAEAKKYGARAALFGRKINDSEHQSTFIQFLRWIADGQVTPEEAVRAYHGVLVEMKIRPRRPLERDMQLTTMKSSYGGSGTTFSLPARGTAAPGCASVAGILPACGTAAPGCASRMSAQPGKSNGPVGAVPPRTATHSSPIPTVGTSGKSSAPGKSAAPTDFPHKPDGSPDFANMTPAQRLAYHQNRLNRHLD